jgi:hypothetical protein
MKVLTNQPLRKALHKPDTLGRLIQWSFELGEFHIEYHSRTAIKGQALDNFDAEFTTEKEGEMANEHDQVEVPTWTVDVDGSNKL